MSARASCSNDEDRISNLPESIISSILSRLPSKDAVRTCVLSKEWEFKWTSIYDVTIDDEGVEPYDYPKAASFYKYVGRILLLSRNIRSIYLHLLTEYSLDRLIEWITVVLNRNVQEFELLCYRANGLLLPRCFLNNTSLNVLKLCMPCTFKVPSKNIFPNLVHLYLCGVVICNELSGTDTVTFNFPVLEKLELQDCKWLKAKCVEIIAPTLKKYMSYTPNDAAVEEYSMKVIGNRLMDIECSGPLLENLILTSSSVVQAALHLWMPWNNHARTSGLHARILLNELQILDYLDISGSMMTAMAEANDGLVLPKFNKLRHISTDSFANFEIILEVLHAAPYLKSLRVQVDMDPVNYYEAVEHMPYCLLKELERVEFWDYSFTMVDGTGFVLEKFFLKNGLVLKAFDISVYEKEKIPIIMESLVSFPKGSDCLELAIH